MRTPKERSLTYSGNLDQDLLGMLPDRKVRRYSMRRSRSSFLYIFICFI